MPPTEADISKIGDALDAINTKLGTMGSFMDKMFGKMGESANKAMGVVSNATNNASAAIGKITNEVGNFANKMGIGIDRLEESIDNFDKLDDSTKKTMATIASFTTQAAILSGVLDSGSKAFAGLDSRMTQSSKNAQETIAQLSKLGGVFGTLGDGAGRFLSSANFGKAFENELISALNAGSNFNAMVENDGKSLAGKMDGISANLIERANQTAKLTGISFNEALAQHVNMLSKLPGEYNEKFRIIDLVVNGSSRNIQMNSIESLTLVSRGLGLALNDVVGVATSMKGTFGSSAWAASERLAVLGNVAKTTTIPLEALMETTKGLDDTFKMWGDQALSTVGIINNVSSALQGTNVGFKGQLEIVNTLVRSISNLSIGTKAFIGISSGMRSAGGAVGVSLDIERMMQRGETGKIAGMMQNTLEQKGGVGRVVSLNETEQNPEMQRAFMIQRELLKSQFGISDTGTANRLMDVMAKTKVGAGTGADAGAELNKVLNEGKSTAERQTNILEDISRNTQHLSALEAVRNYKSVRSMDEFMYPDKREGEERKISTKRTQSLNKSNMQMSREAALGIDDSLTESSLGYVKSMAVAPKALTNLVKGYGDAGETMHKNAEAELVAINKKKLELNKTKSAKNNEELAELNARENQIRSDLSGLTATPTTRTSPFANNNVRRERLDVPPTGDVGSIQNNPNELKITIDIMKDGTLDDTKNTVIHFANAIAARNRN